MFIHHVYFWLKDKDNSADYAQLLKGIKSLDAIEPKILSHIGVPAATDRAVIDTSYSFSLLLTFNNLEDQESYQVHPIHLKFVEENAHLWSKVIVYDSVDA
jgi:hypothetical protein